MSKEDKETKGIGPIKYLIIVVVLLFIAWATIKYFDYKRFDPPTSYHYQINETIDINYHDQLKVQQYIENVYRMSSFANEQWYNYEIDVRFPDLENPQSILANKVYQTTMSNTVYLEKVLKQSAELKTKGLDNTAIKIIEETGQTVEAYKLSKLYPKVELKDGDDGQDVLAIQKILNAVGYEIPETGLYSTITKEAVIDYQTKNNIFPTGIVGQQTLHLLLNLK